MLGIDLTPQGGLLVQCGPNGLAQIWDPARQTLEVCAFIICNKKEKKQEKRVSQDSHVLQRKLEGHVNDVTTCQFFPSGEVVLTVSLLDQVST